MSTTTTESQSSQRDNKGQGGSGVQALVASAHRNHRMVIRHGVAVADGRASTREVRALNAANEAEKEHARLHIPASATWEQATQPGLAGQCEAGAAGRRDGEADSRAGVRAKGDVASRARHAQRAAGWSSWSGGERDGARLVKQRA